MELGVEPRKLTPETSLELIIVVYDTIILPYHSSIYFTKKLNIFKCQVLFVINNITYVEYRGNYTKCDKDSHIMILHSFLILTMPNPDI